MKRLKKLFMLLVVLQVVNTVSGMVLNNLFLRQQLGDGEINVVGVSTKTEEKVTSTDFNGGYLRAVMGLAKSDLTEVTIKNPPATIETTVVMGSAEIMVPEHWKVKVNIRTIMGGVLSDDGEAGIKDDEAGRQR